MTDGSPDREALDTAQDLTKGMKVLADEVKRLRTYGRYNRKFIVVDIVLTILLTAFGYLSVHAANQAHSAGQVAAANHANLVAACQAGNQTRAEQVMLWDFLAHLSSPPPHLTKRELAANRKKVAELLAYVRTIFAKKNCKRVYATSGPGR